MTDIHELITKQLDALDQQVNINQTRREKLVSALDNAVDSVSKIKFDFSSSRNAEGQMAAMSAVKTVSDILDAAEKSNREATKLRLKHAGVKNDEDRNNNVAGILTTITMDQTPDKLKQQQEADGIRMETADTTIDKLIDADAFLAEQMLDEDTVGDIGLVLSDYTRKMQKLDAEEAAKVEEKAAKLAQKKDK